MSGDIAYCFEEDDIERAAEVMESKQIRRLPILNCDKKLAGMFRSAIFLYARNGAASRKPLRRWKIYQNPANPSAKIRYHLVSWLRAATIDELMA